MVKPDFRLMTNILRKVSKSSEELLIGAEFGEDSSAIRVCSKRVLTAHSDPISGAVKFLGKLSIHIPANDIAVTGARPRYFLVTLLVPQELSNYEELINSLIRDMREAADSLDSIIVGGHTELTDAVTRPLVVTTALGVTSESALVRTSGAKPGDAVIITKWAGIEGTAVIATDFRDRLVNAGLSKEIIEKAAEMINNVSVVKEALMLAEHGLANSMHDPTEGGIIAGLTEVAYASKTSITVRLEDIPVSECTKLIANSLGINPLKMLSSGALIATVPRSKVNEAIKLLRREGVNASLIGYVTNYEGYLLRLVSEGEVIEEYTQPFSEDEVIKLWLEK